MEYPTYLMFDSQGVYDLTQTLPTNMRLSTVVNLLDLSGIDEELAEIVQHKIEDLVPYLDNVECSIVYEVTGTPDEHLIYLSNLIKFAINQLREVRGDSSYMDDYPSLVESIASYASALDQDGEITPLIEAIFAPGSPYHHIDGYDNCTDIFSEYLTHLTTEPLPRQLIYHTE